MTLLTAFSVAVWIGAVVAFKPRGTRIRAIQLLWPVVAVPAALVFAVGAASWLAVGVLSVVSVFVHEGSFTAAARSSRHSAGIMWRGRK